MRKRCRGRLGLFFTFTISLIFIAIFTTNNDKGERREIIPDNLIPEILNHQEEENLMPSAQNFDPKFPKIPHSLYDHIYYSSYVGGYVYDNKDSTMGRNKRQPRLLEKNMFKQVQDKVIEYLANLNKMTYSHTHCNDIRYRTLPSIGLEMDVFCRQPNSPEMDRITLEIPLKPPRIVYHFHHSANTDTTSTPISNTNSKKTDTNATKTDTLKNNTNTDTIKATNTLAANTTNKLGAQNATKKTANITENNNSTNTNKTENKNSTNKIANKTENKNSTNTSANKTDRKNTANNPNPTTATTNINIVVPLTGRTSALKIFLDNLKNVMKGGDGFPLGLTIVYFEDDQTQAARDTLDSVAADIPRLVTHFLVLSRQNFSRSLGLKSGVEQSTINAPIVFLCDVDVLFTKDFLYRCLITPIQSKQVFFPMVFSLYNPKMLSAAERKLKITDDHGYWRVWGHGMSCLYKSDFLNIKGFDPKVKGWGGEDLNFLTKTSNKKYKIVRSLEPGLFHHYHPKNCSAAGKGKSWACAKVQAVSEASSLTYGLWFFRNKYNSSSWGILKQLGKKLREEERKQEFGWREEQGWREKKCNETGVEKGMILNVGFGIREFLEIVLLMFLLLTVILMSRSQIRHKFHSTKQ